MGNLFVGRKKNFGSVSFCFEIVDQSAVVHWRHSFDPEDLFGTAVSNAP